MFFQKNILREKSFVVFALIVIFLVAGQVQAEEKVIPKDKKEKIGYSIGVDLGREMKNLSIEIDADMVARGVKDAFIDKTRLSDDEMRAVRADLNKEAQNRRNEKTKTLGEKNKVEGEAFLKENAQKNGIVTLPSGLQYRVMKEGTGKIPNMNDTVIIHYKGAILDGTEFDNSRKRNQVAEFVLGKNVLPGWNEALQKMKVGSRWLVIVPSNLAYGERGAGEIVGPNAVLMFDIELLAVK
jgi:FKBP-type peptidyl-prolyl cis-trans isomerase FklB